MKCSICGCVIDQAEADRGAEAAGPGHDTLCEDCGRRLDACEDGGEDCEATSMIEKCPKCGSSEVSGLMAAFWAHLDPDGSLSGEWSDYEDCTEISEQRMCRACQHEWTSGEEEPA